MSDLRSLSRAAAGHGDAGRTLREFGARAHQLRATTRAADHYAALDGDADRNTASWLMSCALWLSNELAADVDAHARSLKELPVDASLQVRVAQVRRRVHQVAAAARAADHFLDQDSADERETGSWLIATALGLANALVGEIDDATLPALRGAAGVGDVGGYDAAPMRRMAAAAAPVRGAA